MTEGDHTFAGQVVLVTGGGRSLGATLARHFAARGAHVIINHFHARQAANELAEEITANGGSCETIWASVAQPDHVQRMFQHIKDTHAGLDILINNAAAGAFLPLTDIDETYWERAFQTNIMGLVRCSLHAAPLMTARPHPAIVNLSSLGAEYFMPGYSATGWTKASIECLTHYFAAEFGPLGIRVNAVRPAVIGRTDIVGEVPGLRGMVDASDRISPLGAGVSPQQVASAVAFLAGDAAASMTGEVLVIDAGISALSPVAEQDIEVRSHLAVHAGRGAEAVAAALTAPGGSSSPIIADPEEGAS